jgi:phospholipid-binding lipoprotein MlaA
VDDAVLKPVATAYKGVTPPVVRTGVGHFFGNLGDVWSFVNNVLQAKPEASLSSFWRVVVNTTMGLGGVLDPATDMRLTRYSEDFGQTLGYWGMPAGPYLVLPLAGPSTLRDTAALPVDWYGYPLTHVSDVPVRNTLTVVRFVDTRARLLGATDLLEQGALDPYSFQRDVFLQMRRNQVYDGNPPPEPEPAAHDHDDDHDHDGAAAPPDP